MPGASQNLACTNVMLNTAVADALAAYASELEAAPALGTALPQLIRRELRAHSRILFNGNGYGPEWPAEAERRGLLNPVSYTHLYCGMTEAQAHHALEQRAMDARISLRDAALAVLNTYGEA